jgi:hypothetical protein
MNVFEAILAHQVDEDLIKGDLNDEPAEMRTEIRKGDMDDDAHHGGDELVGEENDPVAGGLDSVSMVAHTRIGAAGTGHASELTRDGGELGKSEGGKANSSMSETSAAGLDGAQTLRGASFESPAFEAALPVKSGMPSVDAGGNVILSDDDVDVEQQMGSQKRAVESVVPAGSADVGENRKLTRDGGDLAKSKTFRHVNAIAESRFRNSEEMIYGVGVAPTPQAAPEVPQGQTWQQGAVTYSTSEDERISKAMDEQGNVLGEPSLNWQAPLIKGRHCGLCKSQVPSFLTVCPACGGNHGITARQGMTMEKSVERALQEPRNGDIQFPGGVITINED